MPVIPAILEYLFYFTFRLHFPLPSLLLFPPPYSGVLSPGTQVEFRQVRFPAISKQSKTNLDFRNTASFLEQLSLLLNLQ